MKRSYALLILLLLAGRVNGQSPSFQQSFHTATFTSSNTTAIISADLRKKGYADLIVLQPTQVCVLLNDGSGNFSAPSCTAIFTDAVGLATTDVNNDGNLDVVVLDGTLGLVTLLGDGQGGFSQHSAVGAPGIAKGGVFGGPFAAVPPGSNGSANIVTSGGNCGGSLVGDTPPSTTAVEYYPVSITTIPDCHAFAVGVVNNQILVRGADFLVPNIVNTSSNPPVAYTYCGPQTTGLGNYSVSFDASGDLCLQTPPSTSTLGTATFPLTGNQSITGVTSIIIGSGQPGYVGLVTDSVPTSLALVYGSSVTSLTSSGSIPSFTQPTLANANVFRPTGIPAQDLVVVDQNGLTILLQGTFSALTTPASVTFPAQMIGTSSSQSVKYTNTGTAALTPIQIALAGSPDFTQTNNCPTTLPPAAFCTITTQFLPGTVELTSSATLLIQSTLLVVAVPLNGSEILFVQPVLSQPSISFANQLVNTSSTSQTVTIANQGNTSMTATVATSGSGFSTVNNCTSVAPGATCNLTVTFTPTAPGLVSGNVLVQSGSASANLAVSGTGVAAPIISNPLVKQTVVAGSTVAFSITTTGTSPLTYVWKKGAATICGNTGTCSFVAQPGDDQSTISVTVSNTYGTASSSAVLTVNSIPSITAQPQPISVTLGQTATFSVVASGTAPLQYQWTKSGAAVGTNTASYITAPTVAGDNGALIQVTVTNAAGHVASSTAILTVNFPSAITQQPTSQSITLPTPSATAPVTFSLLATGTNLSYQWKRNGGNVGTNSPSYSYSASASNNGDIIQCAVSDLYGPTSLSNAVTLTVNFPPTITATSPTSLNVGAGQTTTFAVSTTGTQPLSITWSKNGTVVAGATGTSYTTPALVAGDDKSTFTATVTNSYGTASLAFQVFVVQPPQVGAIMESPSAPLAGQSVTLSVSASASYNVPLTYQWTRGGALISGATSSSYVITNPQGTDSGAIFTVSVTDLDGTTSSQPFALNVITPQIAFSFSPTTQTITAGQTATYTANIGTNNTGAPVNISCTTTVPNATCVLSANILTTGPVAVTVVTTAQSSVPFFPIFFSLIAALVAYSTRPRLRKMVLATACGVLLLGGCGVGGGSTAKITPTPPSSPSPTPTPTPSGSSYTVTVTIQNSVARTQESATLVVN